MAEHRVRLISRLQLRGFLVGQRRVQPGDELMPLFDPPTTAAGFPLREDVRRRYAELSGRDLAGIDYYVALAFWKLAIILEGVFARYAAGQYGKDEEGYQQFAQVVERLAEGADQAERRLR